MARAAGFGLLPDTPKRGLRAGRILRSDLPISISGSYGSTGCRCSAPAARARGDGRDGATRWGTDDPADGGRWRPVGGLTRYFAYYHQVRTHLALDKDAPDLRPDRTPRDREDRAASRSRRPAPSLPPPSRVVQPPRSAPPAADPVSPACSPLIHRESAGSAHGRRSDETWSPSQARPRGQGP
jgi:hypothetical protein